MPVSNYLKRPDYRGVKEHDLRFMLDAAPKLLFYQLHTIAKLVHPVEEFILETLLIKNGIFHRVN